MKTKNYLLVALVTLLFSVGNIYAQETKKDVEPESTNNVHTSTPLVELSSGVTDSYVYVFANVKSLKGVEKVIWTYSPNPEGGNIGGVTLPASGSSLYLTLPRKSHYHVTFSLDPVPEGEPNYYMIDVYAPN